MSSGISLGGAASNITFHQNLKLKIRHFKITRLSRSFVHVMLATCRCTVCQRKKNIESIRNLFQITLTINYQFRFYGNKSFAKEKITKEHFLF